MESITNGVKEIDFQSRSWRDQLRGAAFSQKLSIKIAKARIAEAQRNRLRFPELGMVAALNREGVIKEVGFNSEGDLFLDNFGQWLAGIVVCKSNQVKVLKDITGTNRTLRFTHIGDDNRWNKQINATPGMYFQLGSGTTAPARSNYCIETAFAGAPENAKFEASWGMHTSGFCVNAGAISAGGSGTVNESIAITYWATDLNNEYFFAIVRDAICPGVSFVPSDVLCATLTFTF